MSVTPTPPRQRLTIDQRLQKSREEGYLAGRLELQADLARAEARIADLQRTQADLSAALEKEREANEPIDLWPKQPVVIKLATFHNWPVHDEHLFNKWQANTPLPKATQYRACIHPSCSYVQYRDTPKG